MIIGMTDFMISFGFMIDIVVILVSDLVVL